MVSGIEENQKTKEELIQILEEKLKGMKDIELGSVGKMYYRDLYYDIREKQFNLKNQKDLMSETRRTKATSKGYAVLKAQVAIHDER